VISVGAGSPGEQPFPTFSEIYVGALKALSTRMAAACQPDGALAAS
jgi:hypothetical protein